MSESIEAKPCVKMLWIVTVKATYDLDTTCNLCDLFIIDGLLGILWDHMTKGHYKQYNLYDEIFCCCQMTWCWMCAFVSRVICALFDARHPPGGEMWYITQWALLYDLAWWRILHSDSTRWHGHIGWVIIRLSYYFCSLWDCNMY